MAGEGGSPLPSNRSVASPGGRHLAISIALTADARKVNGNYQMGEHLGFRHSDPVPLSGTEPESSPPELEKRENI